MTAPLCGCGRQAVHIVGWCLHDCSYAAPWVETTAKAITERDQLRAERDELRARVAELEELLVERDEECDHLDAEVERCWKELETD